jgi:hypothetical protein
MAPRRGNGGNARPALARPRLDHERPVALAVAGALLAKAREYRGACGPGRRRLAQAGRVGSGADSSTGSENCSTRLAGLELIRSRVTSGRE